MNSVVEVRLASQIAVRVHCGQLRRDGREYITHPQRVAANFPDDDALRAVAWLHDVIEDCGETVETLLAAGLSREVVDAVVAITHVKGEDYNVYLARVKGNELARQVKIADMLDNLNDRPTEKQKSRYIPGLLFLAGLSDH